MSIDRSAAELTPNVGEISPGAVTSEGLPIVLRGYERERVDRLLSRVSEAYLHVWRQRDAMRERLASLESDLEAAEGEAKVSARSVADLVQRVSTAEHALAESQTARDDLAKELQRVEAERKHAVAELRSTAERAADLGARAEALEEALRKRPQGAEMQVAPAAPAVAAAAPVGSEADAAHLLLVAARASDELRASAREQARKAMRKVRARAAVVSAETEREEAVLARLQERRSELEHQAEEVLAQAHAEAERVAATVAQERDRVRQLLTGALASLDQGTAQPPEGLVAELSSRLRDTASDTGEMSEAAAEPDA
jgi:chromosome segregation ATPase